MIKKLAFATLLFAVYQCAFGQATEAAQALNVISKIHQDEIQKQIKANAVDLKSADIKAMEKAKEYTSKVDLSKISSEDTAAWARIFMYAMEYKTAEDLAKKYRTSVAGDATKSDEALDVLIEASSKAGDTDELKADLDQVSDHTASSMYIIYLYTYADQIEATKGPQVALDTTEKFEKKVNFEHPTFSFFAKDAARYRMSFAAKKADFMVKLGRREEALKLLDDYMATPGLAKDVVSMAKGARTQLAVRGLEPPKVNLIEKIGDFQSLGNLKGKVVVLDFFAHWCGPCKASFPDVKKMYADLHDKGLEVVSVTEFYGSYEEEQNLSQAQEFAKMKAFMKEHELPWSAIFVDQATEAAFGVTAIPNAIVIGRDGKIAEIHEGYSADSFARFRASIEKLLAEK